MFSELLNTAAEAKITITTSEVIILMLGLTLCLLFRWNRIGLIVSYLSTFYLGWIFCRDELLAKEKNQFDDFVTGYIIFGVLVLILSVIDMFRKHSEE